MIHLRKKRKDSTEPYDPQLSLVDYEGIATSMQESMEGSMTMIVSSQTKMKTTLDMIIVELKILLEQTAQMPTTTMSTSGTQREDSKSQGRMRFVCILPMSVRLP